MRDWEGDKEGKHRENDGGNDGEKYWGRQGKGSLSYLQVREIGDVRPTAHVGVQPLYGHYSHWPHMVIGQPPCVSL